MIEDLQIFCRLCTSCKREVFYVGTSKNQILYFPLLDLTVFTTVFTRVYDVCDSNNIIVIYIADRFIGNPIVRFLAQLYNRAST
jgi:hypothetical protein